jgi:glycosyltransferase involved in cell wall biosynthesis
MEKKALFIVFHGFDPNNGISKKITYQINALNACGIHTHLCYMEEKYNKTRMVDGQIIADYGSGLKSKILKRTEFSSIVRYAIKEHITFVYIRSNHNANPFTINMVRRMKKAGMKVVMEIPTYPYDTEYLSQGMGKQILQDRIFRKLLAQQLDAIVTFSDADKIFGKRTIRISNGIDFNSIHIKKTNIADSSVINLIGVAEIHPWHGFDRVIKGLAAYYSKPHDVIVIFHIVGYFFFNNDEAMYKQMISDFHLDQYIILHGKKHGDELDKIFDTCNFGIGSLGRHRVGIYKIKTLKNREYAARGIPFIYSETDEDFDDKEYVMKAPADETAIDISSIISFYRKLTLSPTEIRASINNLSWNNQMKKVVESIFEDYKD